MAVGQKGWGALSSLFSSPPVASLSVLSHSSGSSLRPLGLAEKGPVEDKELPRAPKSWIFEEISLSQGSKLSRERKMKLVSCLFIPLWLRSLTINASDSCFSPKGR